MKKPNTGAAAVRPDWRERRKAVARLFKVGRTVGQIAQELGAAETAVRRDLRALRAEAARRRPWEDRSACRSAFIEAAEDALQKVRAAQENVKKDSSTYLNLVKLEWSILVKFIEMTAAGKAAGKEGEADEEDFTRLTNEEMLQKARELGIDVAPFERALRSQPEDPSGDDGEQPGGDDLDEAA